MKNILILVLLVVCAALIGRQAVMERGLRRAARQMREQMADQTTARLALPCPSAGAEELLVCLNDLLELRQEERALYRRKEQELRRQIANVSHDLRTPLTSILGYLQLLEGEGLSPEKKAEYLAVVWSAICSRIWRAARRSPRFLAAGVPLWIGAQAAACMCQFLIQGDMASSFLYVGIVFVLENILDVAGLLIGGSVGNALLKAAPYFPARMLNEAKSVVGDMGYLGRAWIVGAFWVVLCTAVGLYGFHRKEIK